jgi:hypothetical protein
LVAKWRASGQSVPKFSAEYRLSSSSLYQWVTERRTGGPKGKRQGRSKAVVVQPFTEVAVTGHVAPKRGGTVTIETANGHTVTVGGDDVDADVLRTVLSVVNAC